MPPLMMRSVDFERIEDLVLLVLAHEFETQSDEYVSLARICERLPTFGVNPIREAARGLRRDHLIEPRYEVRFIGPMGVGKEQKIALESYRVTRSGIRRVADLEEAYFTKLWTELASNSSNDEATPPEEVPWEPLQIDRSTPEYREMEEVTTKAIERIEADNAYAANAPEERRTVVATLKGAMKAITEGWPSRVVIRASLVSTLRFVAEKFAGTGIGEVAKKAIDAVWKWLLTV